MRDTKCYQSYQFPFQKKKKKIYNKNLEVRTGEKSTVVSLVMKKHKGTVTVLERCSVQFENNYWIYPKLNCRSTLQLFSQNSEFQQKRTHSLFTESFQTSKIKAFFASAYSICSGFQLQNSEQFLRVSHSKGFHIITSMLAFLIKKGFHVQILFTSFAVFGSKE